MSADNANEPIPSGQIWYDRVGLLLFLGVVVPTLIYTVWGLIDVMTVPPLPLVP